MQASCRTSIDENPCHSKNLDSYSIDEVLDMSRILKNSLHKSDVP